MPSLIPETSIQPSVSPRVPPVSASPVVAAEVSSADASEFATGDADTATPYLDRTSVVYERTMPSGPTVVVRLSDESYGDFFGVEWLAETGSAAECLSAPAALIGAPNGEPLTGEGGVARSVWMPHYWPDVDPESKTEMFDLRTRSRGLRGNYRLVRSGWPVASVTVSGDGVLTDSAEFVDGVAVVEIAYDIEARVTTPDIWYELEPDDGVVIPAEYPRFPSLPETIGGIGGRRPSLPCGPDVSDGSIADVVDAGEPPVAREAAERQIRERFELLYDFSVPFDEKPADLLDDPAGMGPRITSLLDGPNGDEARAAAPQFGQIVFTSPTEAWLTYDYVAQNVFFGRWGQVVFNGEVWQITSATLCQDLAIAGYCASGDADPTLHPLPAEERERRNAEGRAAQNLYYVPFLCTPVFPCSDDYMAILLGEDVPN